MDQENDPKGNPRWLNNHTFRANVREEMKELRRKERNGALAFFAAIGLAVLLLWLWLH